MVWWRIECGGPDKSESAGRHISPSPSLYLTVCRHHQSLFKRPSHFQLGSAHPSMLPWESLRALWHFAVTVMVVFPSTGFFWCTNVICLAGLWLTKLCVRTHTLYWYEEWGNLGSCYICTFIRFNQITPHQHLRCIINQYVSAEQQHDLHSSTNVIVQLENGHLCQSLEWWKWMTEGVIFARWNPLMTRPMVV